MTKLKLLGAAALVSAAIATPALAQQSMQEPGAYAQTHPRANDYNYNYRYGRSGFWPGDVAAGVVVGAIGTADAIASAPFRGSAYDANAYYGGPDEVYDYRSTCGPQAAPPILGRMAVGIPATDEIPKTKGKTHPSSSWPGLSRPSTSFACE